MCCRFGIAAPSAAELSAAALYVNFFGREVGRYGTIWYGMGWDCLVGWVLGGRVVVGEQKLEGIQHLH